MTHARVLRKLGALSLDLDLPLPPGITALVGPAGAGKSLLLDTIAGFATADSGRILIEDAIVYDAATRIDLPARRRACAYIGARDALFPRMTIRQNLMFAAARWPRLERHKRVAEMLERFELTDALELLPEALAPARRLRAEIARALTTEPKVLLIDERRPDELLLRILASAFEGPVLLVTRDLDLCYSSAAFLVLMEAGRVIQRGPARETIDAPDSVDSARLLGIPNLFAATIAALDPGRNQSRLECEAGFTLDAPYLKGHFKGDRVWAAIRAEDVHVHSGEIEPDTNYLAVTLARVIEHTRTVRLEFAEGIVAQTTSEAFHSQRDNRSWQVELPPAALRIF